MESARFKVTKKTNDFKIPFALDDSSLSHWLNGLFALDHLEALNKLFCVIEALKEAEISNQQRFVLFKKINNCMQLLLEQIESKNIEMLFPLNEDERRLIELIVWSYLGLARSFENIAKISDDKEIKVYCWYQSLYSLAQAYLYIAATYTLPNTGFWRLCYQVYSSAEQADVLMKPIADDKLEKETIDKIFKQIIVISFSDFDQFRAREMKVIFQFIGKYIAQVDVEKQFKDGKKGLFVFDLSQDIQPCEQVCLNDFNVFSTTRSFSSIALAQKVYQAMQLEKKQYGALRDINQALFVRLINVLGKTQTRKFNRIRENRMSRGIVGFDCLCSFLRTQKGESKSVAKKNKPEPLSLVSKGEEHAHQMRTVFKQNIEKNEQIRNIFQLSSEFSEDMNVWNSSGAETNALIEHVKKVEFPLINSSVKGYALCWEDTEDRAKLGDVLGVFSADLKQLEIAIIRRISQLSERSVQLAVEVIGYESTSVFLTRPSDSEAGKWAILLPEKKAIKSSPSLIFKTGDYKIGEFVTVQQDKKKHKCRLSKLLNSTPSVSQVELFYFQDEKMFSR